MTRKHTFAFHVMFFVLLSATLAFATFFLMGMSAPRAEAASHRVVTSAQTCIEPNGALCPGSSIKYNPGGGCLPPPLVLCYAPVTLAIPSQSGNRAYFIIANQTNVTQTVTYNGQRLANIPPKLSLQVTLSTPGTYMYGLASSPSTLTVEFQ